MSTFTSAEWRGPQHEDDTSIGADDGTRWVRAAPSGTDAAWSGWQPGEDGLWLLSHEEMRAQYPEVVAFHLERLAADTRRLVDATSGNAAQGYSSETRDAVLRLADAVADETGETVAQWVITRWLITRQPIRECIDAERG